MDDDDHHYVPVQVAPQRQAAKKMTPSREWGPAGDQGEPQLKP
jgi:hypothetical protein